MNQAVILDRDENKKLRTKEPGEIAKANTDRNRWFIISIALVFVVMIQMVFINNANERAEMNTEAIWVKMYPNGTWDVSHIKPGSPQEFFNATIDKLLADYAIARFGITPATIRRDYGFALLFMSPQLAGEFTNAQGFNAAAKAADILANKTHNTHNIKVGIIDHYEKSSATFAGKPGEVMRTNMYLEEQVITPLGTHAAEPKKYILSIQWRILSPDELKTKSADYFRSNPIGLEIIQQNLYLEPAVKE